MRVRTWHEWPGELRDRRNGRRRVLRRDFRSASLEEGRSGRGAPYGAISLCARSREAGARERPNSFPCPSWAYAPRYHSATTAMMMARLSFSETRNPARSGVSSVRIHLPATGADLLRGGCAPEPAFVHARKSTRPGPRFTSLFFRRPVKGISLIK